LEVVDNKDGDIKKQTLDEATNLASRYDLTTSFPGKENYKITNYQPLTQSEIENNRKLREEGEKEKQIQQEFKTDTKEGKYLYCLDTIKTYQEGLQAIKEGKTEYTNKYGTIKLGGYSISQIEKLIEDTKVGCEELK